MAKTSYQNVRAWRERTKLRMLQAFGGKCCVCGYCRSHRALDFHHLDDADKAFSLGEARSSPRAWAMLVVELRKCVLVCNRCHQELHDGLAEVPEGAPRFDEGFAVLPPRARRSPCSCCGKPCPERNATCSLACAARARTEQRWDEIDIAALRRTMSFDEIGSRYGVSGNTIRKHLRRQAESRSALQGSRSPRGVAVSRSGAVR